MANNEYRSMSLYLSLFTNGSNQVNASRISLGNIGLGRAIDRRAGRRIVVNRQPDAAREKACAKQDQSDGGNAAKASPPAPVARHR
jgi:hypothetical protein